MNHASLFSGIGGLDLAALWAGMHTVIMCECEPYCQKVLSRHFPGVPIIDDIREFTRERVDSYGIGRIDVISGGFPCQPFSHAGKRKGTADNRHLWPEMLRVINDIRPTWVFGENVDGLVSMAQSDGQIVMEDETATCTEAEMVIEGIRKDLEEIGYQSVPVVVPASAIGAMHRRYRIFILAYSSNSQCESGSEVKGILRTLHENGAKYDYINGSSSTQSWTMANSTDERLSQRRQAGITTSGKETTTGLESEPERCGETMANPEGERRESWGTESTRQQGELCATGGGSSCEAVADPSSRGQSRSRKFIESGNTAKNRERETSEPFHVCIGTERTAESGVGGVLDEFPSRLDGCGVNPLDQLIDFISSCPQVAPLGMPQYNWEPTRVATGVKNRTPRLKALGNAVDPLQALPVMYAIKVLHEGDLK